MGLTLVTPPVTEPVSLEDAKAHLRVLHDDEDALIEGLIVAATRHVEKTLGLSLMERTYRLTLDAFSDAIELPRGPVASVSAVTYSDEDGITQTLDDDWYSVDLSSVRQWLVRNSGYSWPALLDGVNAVSVEYVTGFDTLPDSYADIRHAILLLIGHWYTNREAVNIGNITSEIPMAVDALLQPYRVVVV